MRFLRDRQGSECKTLKRVKCKHRVSSGENEKTFLQSPSRQAVDSSLKPAFNVDNAPATVVNGNVVRIQRYGNRRPNCVQETVMETANWATLNPNFVVLHSLGDNVHRKHSQAGREKYGPGGSEKKRVEQDPW
jgi:hypothetical protein